MTPMIPAVVVGADNTTGLQTARILAARGVPVVGLAEDPTHYCCRTRVLERLVRTPTSGRDLVRTLQRLAPSLPRGAVLVPCTDAAVATIARGRDRIPSPLLSALPDHDVVDRLMRKDGFAEHALAHGVPVPRTALVTDEATARRVVDEIGFPFVVKPPVKSPAWEAHAGKVVRFDDAPAWEAAHPVLTRLARPLVVQEWIDGGEDELVSCNGYAHGDGRTVTFVSRKLRQWPRGTGTTSLGEVVDAPEVEAMTVDLVQSLPYRGLFYLEVKRTPNGGVVAIEANVGRPTGRSALAEASGIELVQTMYADLVGLPAPVSRLRRTDVRWIDLRRDTQAAFEAWRGGELSLLDWWRSLRGPHHHAVIDRRDPRPFIGELRHVLRRRFRGGPRPSVGAKP